MKIKQTVKYRPKTVFIINFITGLLFNFFSLLFSLFSKYSDDDMETNKWMGSIIGTIISTIIIVTIRCFIENTILGFIVLSSFIVIVVIVVVIIYIKLFGKKAKEESKKREIIAKNQSELYYADKNLNSLINAIVLNENEAIKILEEDYKIKNEILHIYSYFNPKYDELVVKRFRINDNKATIITLPNISQVQDTSFKFSMIGFIDFKKQIRWFKVKVNGNIESVKKKEDGYFYSHTFYSNIATIDEFEKFLRDYTD